LYKLFKNAAIPLDVEMPWNAGMLVRGVNVPLVKSASATAGTNTVTAIRSNFFEVKSFIFRIQI
jgi:hypothetical protein